MDSRRFDTVAKLFADRRLSRRQALTQGGAGLAAGALAAAGLGAAGRSSATAQDATPEAASDHGPAMLFVQTYQSGSIAPIEGVEGRYTLTLDQGHGQTIYFSDRPDRIVGATETPQFLEGLGFPDDNPPNAALVVESAPGETDVAVVELFNPVYDPISQGVTYDIAVLGNWRAELGMAFHEAPTDLAALAPSFGSAQLFIDDCPDSEMFCYTDPWSIRNSTVGTIPNSDHDGYCYNWGAAGCYPCTPWFSGYSGRADSHTYWREQCNQRFAACNGACDVWPYCTKGIGGEC